jgi:xanthine dehydrogenase YagR molybdenum-binding subunit
MSSTNALTMDRPTPTSLLDTGAQGIIGKGLDRVEGPLKVAGAATYAAEHAIHDVAYGVLVGSKVARGTITAVDADGVRGLPGVIDVVTDFATFARNPQQGGETAAPTQGVEDVQYFGEIVAIVLAESFEVARDAAQQLTVEYQEAAGRFDFDALKGEVEKPTASDQVPPHFSEGDIASAMAQAAVAIDVTYTTPSQNSAAMEPHASIATWDEHGALTLYGSYQMPTSDAQQLAKALGVSAKKVRIVAPYIGGGFGSKLGIAPESVAAEIAARNLGRPVKAVMAGAAIANAVYNATGVRVRDYPLTLDKILDGLPAL